MIFSTRHWTILVSIQICPAHPTFRISSTRAYVLIGSFLVQHQQVLSRLEWWLILMTSEEIYNASEIASIPASPQVELPLTKEEMDRLREQERQIAEHERQMRAAVVEANLKWNALMAEPKAAATVDAKLNVNFVELL